MNILYLSFSFDPDRGPAAIRNSLIAEELSKQEIVNTVHVITTEPEEAIGGGFSPIQSHGKLKISKILVKTKCRGFLGQLIRYYKYQSFVRQRCKAANYDLVFATSSKLGTAFLGAYLATKTNSYFYLDIRDLFMETIDDYFPQIIFKPIKIALSIFDRYSIRRADKINALSTAFREPIKNINAAVPMSQINHGVDLEFLPPLVKETTHSSLSIASQQSKKILLYAGNFGFGQGIENVLSRVSYALPEDWEFHLYGSGSRKRKVLNAAETLPNVIVHPPVEREKLPKIYSDSDVLFLSLNSGKAFSKSIPSKIFEYCATGKPILGFCSGQLEQFVQENSLKGVHFFKDETLNDINDLLPELVRKHYNRNHFVQKWDRRIQIELMVDDILSTVP